MKARQGKLALNRETVRRLDEARESAQPQVALTHDILCMLTYQPRCF